jgi:hypothetical protein
MEMTLLAVRHLMLRHAIGLAPLIALVAPVDRAEAACDRVSPVSGVTVTCTDTTTDANGNTGFGSGADTGNTYNIVSGASVTGTIDGLKFDRGTVNNSGTITGVDRFGVSAGRNIDLVNRDTGAISGGAVGVLPVPVTVSSLWRTRAPLRVRKRTARESSPPPSP